MPRACEAVRVSESPRPSVLFVCVHNAGRSQMAAGYLRAFAGDRVEVRSAGSEPGNALNPIAVPGYRQLRAKTKRRPVLPVS